MFIDGEWQGSLDMFLGTEGYWFIANNEFEFTYNAPDSSESVLVRSTSKKINNNIPEGFEYIQSTQQAFYFINEIDQAEIGDWVIAYNGDVIVGAREW